MVTVAYSTTWSRYDGKVVLLLVLRHVVIIVTLVLFLFVLDEQSLCCFGLFLFTSLLLVLATGLDVGNPIMFNIMVFFALTKCLCLLFYVLRMLCWVAMLINHVQLSRM